MDVFTGWDGKNGWNSWNPAGALKARRQLRVRIIFMGKKSRQLFLGCAIRHRTPVIGKFWGYALS